MAFDKEIPKEYSKRMNEVINFILINLKEDLPLEKLAAVANYSPFHFQKIFKQVTGESPTQFIIRSRLKIQTAFKKIIQSADAHDLLTVTSQFIGVIYPHQGLYRTVVTINPLQPIPKSLSTTEISTGKFASYKTSGNIKNTFKSIKAFAELWIPESGYRIANIFGFEILAENPLTKPYHLMEREIYIPVEPA